MFGEVDKISRSAQLSRAYKAKQYSIMQKALEYLDLCLDKIIL
jgi:hypothetical protein